MSTTYVVNPSQRRYSRRFPPPLLPADQPCEIKKESFRMKASSYLVQSRHTLTVFCAIGIWSPASSVLAIYSKIQNSVKNVFNEDGSTKITAKKTMKNTATTTVSNRQQLFAFSATLRFHGKEMETLAVAIGFKLERESAGLRTKLSLFELLFPLRELLISGDLTG